MNMSLIYIDVSRYQSKPLDYKKIAKQIDGVIIRCGYTGWGKSKSKQKDPLFEKHYKGFSEAGVPIGVYWYSCASSKDEAIREAELTLEYIKGKKIELPVWWDTEDKHHQKGLSKSKLTEIAKAYCETIEDAGYYVGIYGSRDWLYDELDMSGLGLLYDTWVAHYDVEKTNYKYHYGMHQYTSKGRLDGYDGNLDMNKVYKDYQAIIKNAKLNHLDETIYYPIPSDWNGESIIEGLNKIGIDSSFGYRRRIAAKNGIQYYVGLATQNIKLCELLNAGKLKKV